MPNAMLPPSGLKESGKLAPEAVDCFVCHQKANGDVPNTPHPNCTVEPCNRHVALSEVRLGLVALAITCNAAFGVVVPTPKRLFVSSQRRFVLSSVNRVPL